MTEYGAVSCTGSGGVCYFTMPAASVIVAAEYEATIIVSGSVNSNTSIDVNGTIDTATTAIPGVASSLASVGSSVISTSEGKLSVCTSAAAEVRVYNLKGTLVKSQNVPAGQSRITGLPSGIYMVRVSDVTLGKVSIR